MTEKEKMLAGMLYDPTDAELVAQRVLARKLAARFNLTDEDQQAERMAILRRLLGHLGENVEINPDIRFDYGCNTTIGDCCGFNFNLTILDCAEVRFGNNVFVGPNGSFLTPVHPLVADERIPRRAPDGRIYDLEYCKPIVLEDDVWLAGNVTVNGGVTIGRGSVIGSGSVVTRDIPAGVIAVGVPCRVLRPITEADRMERRPDANVR